jgi:hypothetical protein
MRARAPASKPAASAAALVWSVGGLCGRGMGSLQLRLHQDQLHAPRRQRHQLGSHMGRRRHVGNRPPYRRAYVRLASDGVVYVSQSSPAAFSSSAGLHFFCLFFSLAMYILTCCVRYGEGIRLCFQYQIASVTGRAHDTILDLHLSALLFNYRSGLARVSVLVFCSPIQSI